MKEVKHKQHTTDGFIAASGGLHEKKQISWLKSALVLLVVSLAGGLLVWQSYAASASDGIIKQYYYTVTCTNYPDASGLAYWTTKYDAAKKVDEKKKNSDASNQVIATLVAQLSASQAGKNTAANGGKCNTTPVNTDKTNPQVAQQLSTANCQVDLANTDFVKGLYGKYYKGKPIDDAGVTYWVNQLNSCKKKKADVENYFKVEAAKPPEKYTAAHAFPVQKSGETTSEYQSRVAGWLSTEYNAMTQFCCGGLNDSYGWAGKILGTSGGQKWTVQQVLDHFYNTTAKNFKNQMKDPESDFAKRFELRKKLKAAMMARVDAYVAAGHTLQGISPFTSGCQASYEDYKAHPNVTIDILSQCLPGTGLEMGDEYLWTDKIMSGSVTLEEALAAISSGQTPTECVEGAEIYAPSCNSGSKWMSGQDVDEFYTGGWRDKLEQQRADNKANGVLPGSTSQAPIGLPTPNTNTSTNTSQGFTTVPTNNTNPANEAEVVTTRKSPYEEVTSKVKSVSAPAAAVTACTGSKCATVPVNKSKVADIKKLTTTPVDQLCELNSFGNNDLTTCNGYTEEWNNGGSVDNTTKPSNAQETFTTDELKKCVDQYAKLEPGDDSTCVKVARIYLGISGYQATYKDSTEYDEGMQTNVEKFQSDQKISNNSGIVDQATWDKLKEVSGKVQQSKKQAASNQQVVAEITNQAQLSNFAILFASCSKQPTMKFGATGNCVRRAQQILTLEQTVGLPITGKLDDNTVKSVKDFQQAHGLEATGVVNKETWTLLEAAQSTETYRSPYKAESGSIANNRQ